MTELAQSIAGEILRDGPMAFSRFMELALYHPIHGYYRREPDPFGRAGDFYTAEQLQPVFGRLMAAYLRTLANQLGQERMRVVELGAGRMEMSEAFAEFRYTPVDVSYGAMPARFAGIVFANELFDAAPVDLIVARGGAAYQRRVAVHRDRFIWDDSEPAGVPIDERVRVRELQTHRLAMLSRISESLESGFIVTVDYGYTVRELIRFPQGTLMSYYRHTAVEDVLLRPGEQDITAHVDWTALEEHGRSLGLETVRFESLASALLRAGEADRFASALAGAGEAEQLRLRMQLKSLLFGMGETFRVLVQRKS